MHPTGSKTVVLRRSYMSIGSSKTTYKVKQNANQSSSLNLLLTLFIQ